MKKSLLLIMILLGLGFSSRAVTVNVSNYTQCVYKMHVDGAGTSEAIYPGSTIFTYTTTIPSVTFDKGTSPLDLVTIGDPGLGYLPFNTSLYNNCLGTGLCYFSWYQTGTGTAATIYISIM